MAALERQRPAEVQARLLARLVARGAATTFGRRHGLARVRTVEDFRSAVPLRTYEQHWEEFWRPVFPHLRGATWPEPVPWLARSSGTTSGKTKYVPVTARTHRANVRAALDVFSAHLAAVPDSDAAGGRGFVLGGSTALDRLAPGVSAGDLTGIAASAVPRWLEWLRWPPARLARLHDWDEKLDALAHAALDVDVRTLGGVVPWVLMLLERVAALRRARGEAGTPFPRLRLLSLGGVSLAPYLPRLAPLLPPGVDVREVYAASEGFVAFQDRGAAEGLRVVCDRGVFVELVPLGELGAPAPRRFGVADAEPGVDHAVALTTPSGLWAYLVGDVVRVVSRDPPRVTFAGRTAMMLSAFGEHVLGAELEAAAAAAAAGLGTAVAELAVVPVFPERAGGPGVHLWIVELAGQAPPGTSDRLAAALDADLRARNDDYDVLRAGGVGLAPPDVRLVPPGTFLAWMRRRGKLGGQHKVPRVLNDPALQDDLLGHCGMARRASGPSAP